MKRSLPISHSSPNKKDRIAPLPKPAAPKHPAKPKIKPRGRGR